MPVRVKNMPVDLRSLPDRAARPALPSIKRWGTFFVSIFLLLNIVNHLLYSNSDSKPTLYLFFLTLAVWGCFYAIRYFIYLLGKWRADGWDNEREKDKRNRIALGQRKITLLSQSLVLPHVIHCSDLSTQILEAKKTHLLPSEYNGRSIYSAHFFDIHAPLLNRIINRLNQLLNTSTLSAHIHQLSEQRELTVILSLGQNIQLSETDKQHLHEQFVTHLVRPFKIHYQQNVDSLFIDSWLDNLRQYDTVLLINLYLFDTPINHQSEVALAQLFSSSLETHDTFTAYLHRPEVITDINENSFNEKLEAAILWAKTSSTKIKHLWLTAPREKERSYVINNVPLLTHYSHFKLVDINQVIGHTGHSTLWLNIFISATHCDKHRESQLVIDEQDSSYTTLIALS